MSGSDNVESDRDEAMTDRVRARKRAVILQSLEQGSSRTDASKAAGICRRTLYNWMEADAAFREAVDDAELAAVETVEDVAFRCATKAEDDPRYQTSMLFWLKCRARWTERQRAEEAKHVEVEDARKRLLALLDGLDGADEGGAGAGNVDGGDT